jgi:anti-sigma factor RsiW
VNCPELLTTQAYFDGELDALSVSKIEHHIEGCTQCRTLLQDLEQTKNTIRREFVHDGAPAGMRERILFALDEETPIAPASRSRPHRSLLSSRRFWIGAWSGAGGALAAAAIAVLLWTPLSTDVLLNGLVTEHVDSLLPGHLTSVESSDHHTVKPWFAGHTDVSPLVQDFSGQGFPLVGGRADYLANQRSAVLVYQHGSHIINVFSWKKNSAALLHDTTHSGYHIAFWRAGDLQYCAVSDAGWDELHRLAQLFRELAAHEGD